MKRLLLALAFVLSSAPAFASDCWNNVAASQTDCGVVNMYLNGSSQAVTVTPTTPLPVTSQATVPAAGTAGAGYPPGATPAIGTGSGSTGGVNAGLAGVSGKITYICGFDVSGIGSATGAISPVTVSGLLSGASFVYQNIVATTAAAGNQPFTHTYSPCIPANATNTAINVTTTADATGTAVNVNVWGYQQ